MVEFRNKYYVSILFTNEKLKLLFLVFGYPILSASVCRTQERIIKRIICFIIKDFKHVISRHKINSKIYLIDHTYLCIITPYVNPRCNFEHRITVVVTFHLQ